MKKKRLLFSALIMFVSLIGCHSDYLKNELNLTEEITIIEIYIWDDDILVATIEDKELINKLIKKLNSARTYSTANMDYPLPDYKLVFKNNEQKDIFTIGYYNEIANLGVKGRYLDVRKDVMYEVELRLPIFHTDK